MTSSPPPDPSQRERASRTVLEHLSERADSAPRVLLRDSGADAECDRSGGEPGSNAPPPEQRGHYAIHGEIARGGMGQILRARDTDLGREVAIKVLDPTLSEKPTVLRRFVEEAQIGGQLQHPGIVPVYELGQMADERPFFAMKLVKGRTLAELFEEREGMGEGRARLLAVFESVCQTVAYAHSKGVIHRDLKPANVMVGAFGEVLVVDWGLAKVLDARHEADEGSGGRTVVETVRSGSRSAAGDSIVGSVMGTPAYMPPEQARGEVEHLDERSDVFSLGAILCELLTGAPPYVDLEGERVVVQAAQGRLEPARERVAACDADEELKRLCLECLTAAPTARPRDASEVAQRVREHLAGLEEKARAAELEAVEARVRAAGERRARRLTLSLAAAVVLALLSAGAGVYWSELQSRERVAGARRALDEAQGRVQALQQDERFDEALQVARASLASFEGAGVGDAELAERARRSVELATERVEHARATEERRERETAFVARLEDIRAEQFDAFLTGRFADLDRRYRDAFLDYGVDLSGEDFVPAYEHLRDSDVTEAVVGALDDWALARRAASSAPSFDAEKLTMLAIDLDPHELHTRVREAILHRDDGELLGFTAEPIEAELGPAMVFTVASALWELGHRPEVRAFLDRSCRRYRDDFLLNFVMGVLYRDGHRPDRALVFQQAAATLRPQCASAQLQLGMALFELGDLPAAVPVLRDAVRLDPEVGLGHEALGWALWSLGDLDAALAAMAFDGGAGTRDKPPILGALAVLCARGSEPIESLLARLDASGEAPAASSAGPLVLAGTALFDHEPPHEEAQRLARELGERAAALDPRMPEARLLWADALLRAGDASGALRALDAKGREAPDARGAIELELARAEALHALGERAAARETYERAAREASLRVQNREPDWARSRLVRRVERTRRALGL